MSDFENLEFPHIRYIPGLTKSAKTGYYMGGEPEENSILVVGKQYTLSYHWFSPNRVTERKYVWAIREGGEIYNVDQKNFGKIIDLRERRINQILD